MNQDLEKAFDRVKNIDWGKCGRVKPSADIHNHFSNYIKLANLIVQRLNIKSHLHDKIGGLFNFTAILYRDKYPAPEYVEEWILKEMHNNYNYFRGGAYACQAIHGFLIWNLLPDSEKFKVVGELCVGNPYEEIVSFFEAGGAFTTEHAMLDKVLPFEPD